MRYAPIATTCMIAAVLAVTAGDRPIAAATPSGVAASPPTTLTVAGLAAPVRIVTDRYGIPHIRAEQLSDLYFAWGFVSARDRLWQLEYARRSGDGRLWEWFGNETLRGDGGAQLFELRRRAEAVWERQRTEPGVREPLERYAAGVNALIAQCRAGVRPWPQEFEVLGKQPADWKPSDSVILLLGFGVLLDLALPELAEAREIASHGIEQAVARRRFDGERIYKTIPDSAAARLYGSGSTAVPAHGAAGARGALDPRLLRRAREAVGPWLASITDDPDLGASNVFAVGARRSTSGMPMLANDLHLALATPGRLHIVHVSVPGEVEAIGAAVPGLPSIVSGRNARCAWGITSLAADMVDVYADSLSSNGRSALVDGRWEPIREEPFDMKFRLLGLALPTFGQKRRYTSRGPVLAIDKKRHVALTVRWSWQDRPVTLDRLLGLERSHDAAEITARYRTLVTPGLNVVAADVDGALLYQTVGALPRRGFVPRLGTLPGDGRFAWQGVIEPGDMPAWTVPASGFVVNGNNLPVGAAYDEPLPRFDWSQDRTIRMASLLQGRDRVSLEDMAEVQNDHLSLRAARFVPLLLHCADSLATTLSVRERQALEIVRHWDLQARRDRVGPTIYRAWLGVLQQRSGLAGHLGLTAAAIDGRAPEALHDPENATPERPAVAVVAALRGALDALDTLLGPDLASWRWGRAHQAQFSHALKWKDAALEPPPIPADGDGATPSAGRSSLPDHVLMTHGPVVRHVVDLAVADSSLGVLPPGNSGDGRSTHARDHLERWAEHRYVPFHTRWERIEQVAESEIRLEPRRR